MKVSNSSLRAGLLTYGLDRPPTGVGRYSIELIASLLDLGVSVTLLGNQVAYLPAAATYRSVGLPGCRLLPGLMTLGNLAIPAATLCEDLDLVHDPTGNAPFLFGAGRAKTVVTVHDLLALAFPRGSTLLENIITRFWLPRVLLRADAIITDSYHTRKDILRFTHVAPQKIHVIPIGQRGFAPVDPAKAQMILSSLGLEPGYILTVGTFDPRRNLPRLLEAFARLSKEGVRRKLVIIGKPRLGNNPIIDQIQKLELNGQVVFPGYLASEHLPAVYSAAGLFVFPSLYEGFGLPPLEAMACGTPVIVSNASSLPEVVGDAAVLVDPNNVEALANEMRRVLASPTLQTDLRLQGMKRAAEFTWERTALQTLEVYRQVVGP